MTMNLLDGTFEKKTDHASSSASAETSPEVNPPNSRPLDLGHLVDAAAARLNESWVRPDATGYMMASGLADELAATLCAYGMAASEVAHMHGREDEPLGHVRPPPEGCRDTPEIQADGPAPITK